MSFFVFVFHDSFYFDYVIWGVQINYVFLRLDCDKLEIQTLNFKVYVCCFMNFQIESYRFLNF